MPLRQPPISGPPEARHNTEQLQPNNAFSRFVNSVRAGAESRPGRPRISSAFNAFVKEHPTPTNGIKYISSGEGENVLVVLPGIGEPIYVHAQNLFLQIPNTRVVVVDYTTFNYPSLSNSLRRAGPQDILSDFKAGMDNFLGGLNSKNITLYGTSLGGLLTQAYLSEKIAGPNEHAKDVTKRIFVQTSTIGAEVFQRGFLRDIARVSKHVSVKMLGVGMGLLRRPSSDFVDNMTPTQISRAFVNYAISDYRRKILPEQAEVFRRLGIAFVETGVNKDLSLEIASSFTSGPTLVIENNRDRIFPPAKSGMGQQYSGARVHDLDSVHGHRASWKEIGPVLDKVEDFLLS